MTTDYPQFIKESWIGKFIQYSQPFPTPEIFRKWAAVACVMGGLERRVWVEAAGTRAFPSHYILLVAPPGVGKSRVIKEVEAFWLATGILKVAPQSATKAAMVDALCAAQRTMKTPDGELIMFHSLQVAAAEFGVLIPQYDNEAMNFYNLIWDCDDIYRENRRHGEHKETIIDYPQINMLAGTQPAYLGAILPPDAFGMGFTARLMMVYCGQASRNKLFGDRAKPDMTLKSHLSADLKRITEMVGEFHYTKDAQDYLEDWFGRNDDNPEHPRLEAYSVRRIVTIQKIAMAVAAACSSTMLIEKEHIAYALSLMLEAEDFMPDIFKGMAVPETSGVMAELHKFMLQNAPKFKAEAVPEHMVIDFLKGRVEAFKIDAIMKHMITGGLMVEAPMTQEPGKFVIMPKRFIPIRKQI